MFEKLFQIFRVFMLILGYVYVAFPMGTLEYILTVIFFIIKLISGIDIDNHPKLKYWR